MRSRPTVQTSIKPPPSSPKQTADVPLLQSPQTPLQPAADSSAVIPDSPSPAASVDISPFQMLVRSIPTSLTDSVLRCRVTIIGYRHLGAPSLLSALFPTAQPLDARRLTGSRKFRRSEDSTPLFPFVEAVLPPPSAASTVAVASAASPPPKKPSGAITAVLGDLSSCGFAALQLLVPYSVVVLTVAATAVPSSRLLRMWLEAVGASAAPVTVVPLLVFRPAQAGGEPSRNRYAVNGSALQALLSTFQAHLDTAVAEFPVSWNRSTGTRGGCADSSRASPISKEVDGARGAADLRSVLVLRAIAISEEPVARTAGHVAVQQRGPPESTAIVVAALSAAAAAVVPRMPLFALCADCPSLWVAAANLLACVVSERSAALSDLCSQAPAKRSSRALSSVDLQGASRPGRVFSSEAAVFGAAGTAASAALLDAARGCVVCVGLLVSHPPLCILDVAWHAHVVLLLGTLSRILSAGPEATALLDSGAFTGQPFSYMKLSSLDPTGALAIGFVPMDLLVALYTPLVSSVGGAVEEVIVDKVLKRQGLTSGHPDEMLNCLKVPMLYSHPVPSVFNPLRDCCSGVRMRYALDVMPPTLFPRILTLLGPLLLQAYPVDPEDESVYDKLTMIPNIWRDGALLAPLGAASAFRILVTSAPAARTLGGNSPHFIFVDATGPMPSDHTPCGQRCDVPGCEVAASFQAVESVHAIISAAIDTFPCVQASLYVPCRDLACNSPVFVGITIGGSGGFRTGRQAQARPMLWDLAAKYSHWEPGGLLHVTSQSANLEHEHQLFSDDRIDNVIGNAASVEQAFTCPRCGIFVPPVVAFSPHRLAFCTNVDMLLSPHELAMRLLRALPRLPARSIHLFTASFGGIKDTEALLSVLCCVQDPVIRSVSGSTQYAEWVPDFDVSGDLFDTIVKLSAVAQPSATLMEMMRPCTALEQASLNMSRVAASTDASLDSAQKKVKSSHSKPLPLSFDPNDMGIVGAVEELGFPDNLSVSTNGADAGLQSPPGSKRSSRKGSLSSDVSNASSDTSQSTFNRRRLARKNHDAEWFRLAVAPWLKRGTIWAPFPRSTSPPPTVSVPLIDIASLPIPDTLYPPITVDY